MSTAAVGCSRGWGQAAGARAAGCLQHRLRPTGAAARLHVLRLRACSCQAASGFARRRQRACQPTFRQPLCQLVGPGQRPLVLAAAPRPNRAVRAEQGRDRQYAHARHCGRRARGRMRAVGAAAAGAAGGRHPRRGTPIQPAPAAGQLSQPANSASPGPRSLVSTSTVVEMGDVGWVAVEAMTPLPFPLPPPPPATSWCLKQVKVQGVAKQGSESAGSAAAPASSAAACSAASSRSRRHSRQSSCSRALERAPRGMVQLACWLTCAGAGQGALCCGLRVSRRAGRGNVWLPLAAAAAIAAGGCTAPAAAGNRGRYGVRRRPTADPVSCSSWALACDLTRQTGSKPPLPSTHSIDNSITCTRGTPGGLFLHTTPAWVNEFHSCGDWTSYSQCSWKSQAVPAIAIRRRLDPVRQAMPYPSKLAMHSAPPLDRWRNHCQMTTLLLFTVPSVNSVMNYI